MSTTTDKAKFVLVVEIPEPMRSEPELYQMYVRMAHVDAASAAHKEGWGAYTVRVDLAASRITVNVERIDA